MENGAEGKASFFHLPFTIYHFPLLRCISIAAIWVATAELLRGTWPWHGLPWLYLGYTQTPVLVFCQIADFTGVLGVSFLVALVNAWIAMWVVNGFHFRGVAESGVRIAGLVLLVAVYGVFRIENEKLTPGPTVLVVQPNYPQDNSTGNKGATPEQMLDFHARATEAAIDSHPGVDLTVWSETIMPPLNPEARAAWMGWNVQQFIDDAKYEIPKLAGEYHCAFLVGGEYEANFSTNEKGQPQAADKRNSAYFFNRQGDQSPLRYDKIHLVPFGEFIPFREGFPPLFRLMVSLGPEDMSSYFLQPGSENNLTVFDLARTDNQPAWKFVAPVCFEDIDPGLCAEMFRPEPSTPDKKRADFLVNITNDGWFLANENSQHLQAAIFRSIENRVPSARSVNTGISGFIDPLGHTSGLLQARTEGTSTSVLMLDSRVTFFTLWGQMFAWICAGLTLVLLALSIVSRDPLEKQPTTDNTQG
jgi:apolipoprotein N-acyltransferase